jgi:adenosylhomocysteine nucleosidase
MSHVPIVVLTALDLEYQAVESRLTGIRTHQNRQGTLFAIGRYGANGCEIALGLINKGNHSAAVLAERAMAEFSPRAVLFVGVAGALRSKVSLADVVVATHVYAYHGATSEKSGMRSRPRVWEIPHAADQVARQVARTWTSPGQESAGSARVLFGPIAAGEVVLNSTTSAQAEWVSDHYNDALAIEMEGAGVAQAAHLHGIPAIVIRAISDRADGTKVAATDVHTQPAAAANAADFALRLAERLAASSPVAARPQPEPLSKGKRPPMRDVIRNTTSGNSGVVFQSGNIHGSVVTLGGAAGPEAELSVEQEVALFRRQLRRARDCGHLDEDTYLAADVELRIVEDALGSPKAPEPGILKIALKRLRGLVDDVADLAAKVSVIAALVKGVR